MDTCLSLFSAGFPNTDGNKGKQVKKTNVNYKKTGSMGASLACELDKAKNKTKQIQQFQRRGLVL